MRRLEDIEIAWLLRPFRALRIDPDQARTWAILLAVAIGIALTLTAAYGVLAQVPIGITMVRGDEPIAPASADPSALLFIVGLAGACLVGMGLWRCYGRVRLYRQTIGVVPRGLWVETAAAIVAGLMAILLAVP